MRDESSSFEVSEPFESFYEREYRGVVAFVYALSGSRWAAEDLAQEAFMVAQREWDRIAAYEKPEAWVRRVASNMAASWFRRRAAEARALARLAARRPLALEPLEESAEEFWSAVRRLPRRQAEAVALRYVDDMSVRDIARVLGVAEGTVKALLHKGRNELAKRLRVAASEEPTA